MLDSDDSYSVWITWLCYWLDQFHTLANNAWVLSKFSMSSIYFARFIGCSPSFVSDCCSFLECYNIFSGVWLSKRSTYAILLPPQTILQISDYIITCLPLKFGWYFCSSLCIWLAWTLIKYFQVLYNRQPVFQKKLYQHTQFSWKKYDKGILSVHKVCLFILGEEKTQKCLVSHWTVFEIWFVSGC